MPRPTVTLVHKDLPGRAVTVPAVQAQALRQAGWKDAPKTVAKETGGEIGVTTTSKKES